jgi:ribA/ribD-fused uncharacterized protein
VAVNFESSLLFDASAPPITSFSGEFLGLSNVTPFVVRIADVEFPTLEHAFQALRWPRRQDWIEISKIPSPWDVRRRSEELLYPQTGWEEKKLLIMYKLLQQKFQFAPYKSLLLKTWPRQLIEENHWKDRYWGVYKGKGENWLGRLLMRVRLELIAANLVAFNGEP